MSKTDISGLVPAMNILIGSPSSPSLLLLPPGEILILVIQLGLFDKSAIFLSRWTSLLLDTLFCPNSSTTCAAAAAVVVVVLSLFPALVLHAGDEACRPLLLAIRF